MSGYVFAIQEKINQRISTGAVNRWFIILVIKKGYHSQFASIQKGGIHLIGIQFKHEEERGMIVEPTFWPGIKHESKIM